MKFMVNCYSGNKKKKKQIQEATATFQGRMMGASPKREAA